MKHQKIKENLIQIQQRFLETLENHYITYLKEEHFDIAISNLIQYRRNKKELVKYEFPIFEEEIKIDRESIYNAFSFLLTENNLSILFNKIKTTAICDFLIVLGQRITSATIRDENAIPPQETLLLKESFKPFNYQISKAVRAFEKHAQRTENSFWGIAKGTPSQKEEKIKELVCYLIT